MSMMNELHLIILINKTSKIIINLNYLYLKYHLYIQINQIHLQQINILKIIFFLKKYLILDVFTYMNYKRINHYLYYQHH